MVQSRGTCSGRIVFWSALWSRRCPGLGDTRAPPSPSPHTHGSPRSSEVGSSSRKRRNTRTLDAAKTVPRAHFVAANFDALQMLTCVRHRRHQRNTRADGLGGHGHRAVGAWLADGIGSLGVAPPSSPIHPGDQLAGATTPAASHMRPPHPHTRQGGAASPLVPWRCGWLHTSPRSGVGDGDTDMSYPPI